MAVDSASNGLGRFRLFSRLSSVVLFKLSIFAMPLFSSSQAFFVDQSPGRISNRHQ
jgi:hypothetical protein